MNDVHPVFLAVANAGTQVVANIEAAESTNSDVSNASICKPLTLAVSRADGVPEAPTAAANAGWQKVLADYTAVADDCLNGAVNAMIAASKRALTNERAFMDHLYD